jgi:hypothetical protein
MAIFFIIEKIQAKQAWKEIKLLQSCYLSEESNKISCPSRHRVKSRMAENYDRGPDWGLLCLLVDTIVRYWNTNLKKKIVTASIHFISNS